ncbi:hypothetical protein LTR56_017504 [Elasticomyces elasticus]|nr:hypothetical protein LTR56_017504 [Elasticomyces elasticus]KAK3665095.1 hypothetical protein LTR22_004151 [Elasticomyces elasticus]KAK4931529.1 hypothetical protein LTR49_001917 [Elasticomyces elasticus]KAK5766688.1 hypothetical protein LTS12_003037 [Elasticomyces elasticus]
MATSAPRAGEKRTAESEASFSLAKKQKIVYSTHADQALPKQQSQECDLKTPETKEPIWVGHANKSLRETILRPDTIEGADHHAYHFPGNVDIVFRLFLAWMYTGVIPDVPAAGDKDAEVLEFGRMHPRGCLSNSTRTDEEVDEFGDFCLVKLYYFGTSEKVHDLSDAALSSLAARIEWRGCSVAASAVQYAHEVGAHDVYDNLLEFFVEDSARRLTSENVKFSIVNYPGMFVERVLKKAMGRMESRGTAKSVRRRPLHVCLYHFYDSPAMVGRCSGKCLLPEKPSTTDTRACSDFESTAFISIGADAVMFTAHEQKLCQVSDYFLKAFHGAFAEGSSKKVHLPEERVADFGLFLDWLYTGKLTFPEQGDYAKYCDYIEGAMSGVREHDGWRFREILNLYIFADRRGVPALRNDIIDRIAAWREHGWSHMSSYLDLVNVAYDNLPAQSKLLKYLVDEAAFCWDHDLSSIDQLDEYPKAFVADAMRDLLRYGLHQKSRVGDKKEWFVPDWRDDICRLHEHTDDSERATCKEAHRGWHEKMSKKGKGMEPVRALS